MTPISAQDLQPWLDPDDLLRSIVAIDRKEVAAVAEELGALALRDDPDVREEAIRKLYTQGKSQQGRERLADAFRNDKNPAVREVAALAIAATTSDESRDDDARLLLRTLLDEDGPTELRGASYEALLILYRRGDFPSVRNEVDLHKDVDWRWVHGIQARLNKPA
jgi:HEAT repeat protein